MKSGGFHLQRSGENRPFATILSTTHWMNTEATSMVSKSVMKTVIENSAFQKSLQIKGEVHPKFRFVD